MSPTRPTLQEERRLWRAGHEWVAGVDEVGRGAWAGPLSVGVAVVRPRLRSRSLPFWLRDSKMLTEERREAVFDQIGAWCAAWAVGHATAEECDGWGMTAALRLAAHRALARLGSVPDALLVDGPFNMLQAPTARTPAAGRLPLGVDGEGWDPDPGDTPDRPLPLPEVVVPETVVPLVGADARCAAVSAASILAKVVRDRMMREASEHYPPYHFERNKGYPSPLHKVALRGYGLSAIHRRSWAFVDDLPWLCPRRRPPVAGADALGIVAESQ